MSDQLLLISTICGTTFLVIAIFPFFWVFTVWIISLASRWPQLAEKYRATQPSTGKSWLSQYGFVNGARYGNALNLTTNDLGLFIEPVSVFRINHPRLFIPWSEMSNPTEVVFRHHELIRVDVGHPKITTLSLPALVFEKSEGRRVIG